MLELRVTEMPFTKKVYWDGHYSHDITGIFVVVTSSTKVVPDGMSNVVWGKWVPATWGQKWHSRPLFPYRRKRALKKANRIARRNNGT